MPFNVHPLEVMFAATSDVPNAATITDGNNSSTSIYIRETTTFVQ